MNVDFSFSYGGTVFGGGSGREITGWTIAEKRFEEFSFECDFFINATTDAAFVSEVATVENIFSKPFQDFTVSQGASTLYSFLQSANTGLDARPEILKREEGESRFLRRYRVRITVGLPANTGAEIVSGLREHSVEVAYDPARIRTVSISGVFTAIGGTNARAQYEAQIASLENTVFSILSITATNRELIEEPTADHSYNNKTITFRRVYRELIFSQGGSSNDDSGIVRQSLTVDRGREAPGDVPGIKRLATLTANFDCWIDKNVSTDLRGKYASIRSWLYTQIRNTLQAGTIAVVSETPQYDYVNNRISSVIVAKGIVSGTVFQRTLTLEDSLDTGWVLVPVWDTDMLTKYVYQGPIRRLRTVTDVLLVRGFEYLGLADLGGDASPAIFQNALLPAPPSKFSAVHVSTRTTNTPKRMGLDGQIIDVTEMQRIDVFEFYRPVPSATTPNIPTGASAAGR